jgi:hypothetical protein
LVSLVGAAGGAQAGGALPEIASPAIGASCAAEAGTVAETVSAIGIGAMAAALAGALAVGLLVPVDGAQATALAGAVEVQSDSQVQITGAACAGIAGDVTAKIVVTQLNPNYIAVGLPRNLTAAGMPRSMIAVGVPRDRIVVGISNAMSQTNTLEPPIDATVEVETVTFDYGLILKPGVKLTGAPTITSVVYEGTDPDPASRLVGDAVIGPSPNSGAIDAAVLQLVGNMLAGTTYRLQCVCATTDGQNLSLWSRLLCLAPN